MMNPIPWLEKQIEKAKEDISKAQGRYEACVEMLLVAKLEEATGKFKDVTKDKPIIRPSDPELTMTKHIEKIFYRKQKEMSTKEICDFLNSEGWATNSNSVNTQLNRHKDKFVRNENYKWFLKNPLMGRE